MADPTNALEITPSVAEDVARPSQATPMTFEMPESLVGGDEPKIEAVAPIVKEQPPQKQRSFKRKPPPLPDDYKKAPKDKNKKGEGDAQAHTKRWNRAQEMRRGLIRPQRQNTAMKLLKYTSHAYYNNLWAEAQVELRGLLIEEKKRGDIGGGDKRKTFYIFSQLFYKYLTLLKKMDDVYDQLVHPQKRILIKKLLDLIIVRLLEIRTALVKLDMSEFMYFDEISYIEKIPPSQLDIPIPKYYYHDPSEKTIERDHLWEGFVRDKAKHEQDLLEEEERKQAQKLAEEKWLQTMLDGGTGEGHSISEHHHDNSASVFLIQKMERARQGRVRYGVAKYVSEEEARAMIKKKKKKKQMDYNKAVSIAQKVIRGFIARMRVKRMRTQELELLGLKFSSAGDLSLAAKAFAKCTKDEQDLYKAKERRRQDRRRNQKIYEEAQESIQARLELLEAPEMAERFKYQIRTWMLDVKETTGKLPKMIPKPEAGGSRFYICPNQLTEEQMEKGRLATDKEYAKAKKKEAKKEKKKEKEKKKKEQVNAAKGVIDTSVKLDLPSKMEDMIAANIEYNKIWRARDEKDNSDQRHEDGFIIHEKRHFVGDMARDVVDTALVGELKHLQHVLEGKKKKKGKHHAAEEEEHMDARPSQFAKKIKVAKSKHKYKDKKKEDKKKKKHKLKDLTPGIPIEHLFKQLVDNGIIKKYPEVRLDSFVGSCSLINGEIRSYFETNSVEAEAKKDENLRQMPGDANPLPTFGDVKRAIKDICILPFGSEAVHTAAPLTRSVLICGPEGSGKRTLVNAICTEMHATLFDISPANIGKYKSKKAVKMLMHLVHKVGSALAPSVVKIDNCERVYMKKAPKGDRTKAKRLKKEIGKVLMDFRPGDQLLLVGLSTEPWNCPIKWLRKDYQKVIYIPRPDYGTRMELWRHFLVPHAEYLRKDVHFSLLTKLSEGWTAAHIKSAAEKVIGNHKKLLEKEEKDKVFKMDAEPWLMMQTGGKKISSVGKKLIKFESFLDELSKMDPLFVEQEKAWTKFFNKTSLQKARLASLSEFGESSDKKKKGAKKGK